MAQADQKKEQWEQWFEKYKGSELAEVVIRLTRALLRSGAVTAEDAHSVPVSNPSIRGAAMKCLRRLGIAEKDALAVGTTKQSHGHTMFRWRLVSLSTAQRLLDRVAQTVVAAPAKEEQATLW